MTQETVQHQRGLSVLEFLNHYAMPQQCEDRVRVWRWPNGFIFPKV